jgi:hypothetical protein
MIRFFQQQYKKKTRSKISIELFILIKCRNLCVTQETRNMSSKVPLITLIILLLLLGKFSKEIKTLHSAIVG